MVPFADIVPVLLLACMIQPSTQTFELIAFNAHMDRIQTAATGDTLRFGNVTLDTHNHFNPNTGVFTAPECGFYVFHVSLRSTGTSTFSAELYAGGQYINSLYARFNSRTFSSSVMVRLGAGQVVYLREKPTYQNEYENYESIYFNTFCGYRYALCS